MDYPKTKTATRGTIDFQIRTPQQIVIDPRDKRVPPPGPDPTKRAMDTIDELKRGSYGVEKMRKQDYDTTRTIDNVVKQSDFKTKFMLNISRHLLQRLIRVATPLGRVLDLIEILQYLISTKTTAGDWDFTGYEVVCGPVPSDPTYTLGPYYYGPGHANICGQSGGVTFYSDLHGSPQAVPSYRTGGFSMVMGRDYITGLAARINIIQVWKPIETEGPPITAVKTESYKKQWYVSRQLPDRITHALEGVGWFQRSWRKWEEENLVEKSSRGYDVESASRDVGGSLSGSSSSGSSSSTQTGMWGPGGGTQQRSPPPRREKQTKLKGTAGMLHLLGVINRVYGSLVDYRDVMEAIHDSLPKKYQANGGKSSTFVEKNEAIYRNHAHIDLEKAMRGVLKELLEDVVGKSGAQLRSELGLQNNRANIGYNTGFQTKDGLGKGERELYDWERWLLANT